MKKELEEIQAFLEEPLSDDPDLIVQRGAALNVYLARTAKIQADAQLAYDKVVTQEIKDIIKELTIGAGGTATAANALVKAAGRDQKHILVWAERLNRTCVHQIDWARSVLSKMREEMRMNTYGGGYTSTDRR